MVIYITAIITDFMGCGWFTGKITNAGFPFGLAKD
jgi:hypothetical protein